MKEQDMTRLSLPMLAVLASAMALSATSAFAQYSTLASSRLSTHKPVAVERAALDLPVSSSSSAPDLFEAPAPSAITSQTGSVVSRSEGGARPFSGIAVAIKSGSGGVGFDVATPLVQQRLNLRGGASFFSYSPSTITKDNLNINGSIKLQNAAVMVDYFPFHGRFRISGGMTIYNNTGLTATLTGPTGQSFTVGGMDFYSEPYNAVTNPAGPVVGAGVFTFGGNKIAPRVTIGTGNMLPRKGRFTFQSEVGIQYFSAPTVTYTLSGTGCTTYVAGVYSNCGPIPQSNIRSEQDQLQNDLTDLRFFPILSIGLSYRIH